MKKIKEIFGGIALLIALGFIPMYGWFNNFYQFFKLDFESPYREEVIRGVGIPVVPVGIVVGFININDGE